MNELKSECKEYNALNYRTLIHTGSTLHTSSVETTEESLSNFSKRRYGQKPKRNMV